MKRKSKVLVVLTLAAGLALGPAVAANAASESLGSQICFAGFRPAFWAGAKGTMTLWANNQNQTWNNGNTATTRTIVANVGVGQAFGMVDYTTSLTSDKGRNCRLF